MQFYLIFVMFACTSYRSCGTVFSVEFAMLGKTTAVWQNVTILKKEEGIFAKKVTLSKEI